MKILKLCDESGKAPNSIATHLYDNIQHQTFGNNYHSYTHLHTYNAMQQMQSVHLLSTTEADTSTYTDNIQRIRGTKFIVKCELPQAHSRRN